MNLDSSSNPSSTTSSTPSSPAPFLTSSNPSSATTPPNPSPGQRDSRFSFPGTTPLGFSGSLGMASDPLPVSPESCVCGAFVESGMDAVAPFLQMSLLGLRKEEWPALHCTVAELGPNPRLSDTKPEFSGNTRLPSCACGGFCPASPSLGAAF